MSISENAENRNMSQESLSDVSLYFYMLKEAIDGFNNKMDDVQIIGIYEHFGKKTDWEAHLCGEGAVKFLEQLGTVTVEDFDNKYYEYSVDVGIIRYMCLVEKGARNNAIPDNMGRECWRDNRNRFTDRG